MNTLFTRIAIATGLLGLAHSALAQDCQFLDRFPTEIRESGRYCLDRTHLLNLPKNTSAISVSVPHVEIDLRGYTLANKNADQSPYCNVPSIKPSTTGIRVVNTHNVRITGGSLYCFGTGVSIIESACIGCNQGHRIDRMRIQKSGAYGIFAQSGNSVFESNHITSTGNFEGESYFGIRITDGNGNTIRNNDVQGVFFGTGIGLDNSSFSLVIENRVQNAETGFQIYADKEVRYRDNVTTEVRTPYRNVGTDLGNNQ